LHLKDDYHAIALNINIIYRKDVTVEDFIISPQFRNKERHSRVLTIASPRP